MPKFSKNALTVLRKRYLLRDQKGKIIETPEQLLWRVAGCIARDKKEEKEFYEVMSRLEFLPNSPTLMNAGTDIGQLSACFVIPVEDSLPEIFEAVKDMAMIQQSGGKGMLSKLPTEWLQARFLLCMCSMKQPRSSNREEKGAAPIWGYCRSIIQTLSNL
jgi:ribonucleotide reductase alpha subunit